MSRKFNALVINNKNEKFTREIKELDTSSLKDGNVLVKIDYSSLNYKDALILNNGGKIVRKFPFVPGIDFAGTVVESEDNKFKKNDKVILTGFRVGEAFFGGFAQYAKVESNFLIKIPKDLDTHKSMMLGTAGFTALLCSLDINGNKASGTTYTIEVSTDIEEKKSQIHGQYLDEFIKKGNKWLFLKRTFSILHD